LRSEGTPGQHAGRPSPADELVALYGPEDRLGRVVGVAPRSRVRRENLPHAATAVFLCRPGGGLYVHRRSEGKDLWPGYHDCASGGIALAGEDPDAAAVRELAEELGVAGVPLHPLLRTWYHDPHTWYLAHVYQVEWDGPVSFADGEVAAGWWDSEVRLRARLADPSWPFVPDTRALLELVDRPIAPS
jgi:8-oxo-dGTP pyrophosphatase MutT (NUDIX family)